MVRLRLFLRDEELDELELDEFVLKLAADEADDEVELLLAGIMALALLLLFFEEDVVDGDEELLLFVMIRFSSFWDIELFK